MIAMADDANVDVLLSATESGAVSSRDKEQLVILGKSFFWIVYHTIDPDFIVFSWKKYFMSKTIRWKDLHWAFERVFGIDPLENT